MFSSDVANQLQYYVYRLIDPRNGQTFYVGKGQKNRIYAHINDALNNYDGKSYEDQDEDDVSAKIKQIREIKNAGLEVIHVIHRYGLTQDEAFEVEAALIDCYPGLTNIQGGHSPERGANNADVLQRLLSLEEFKEQDEMKYCIIKVYASMVEERGSVYEAVRRDWKVDFKRISRVPYVLASVNGVVLDVFAVDKWYKSPTVSGRYMFDGKTAPDEVRQMFVNKRLPKKYTKKGEAYPVRYHDGK